MAQLLEHELGDALERLHHAVAADGARLDLRHAERVDRCPQLLDRGDGWQITLVVLDHVGELVELEPILGEKGTLNALLASTKGTLDKSELPATAEAFREAVEDARATLDRANLAVDDLRHSLPAVLAAIKQLRSLARFLEEQPESVIYSPRPKEDSK